MNSVYLCVYTPILINILSYKSTEYRIYIVINVIYKKFQILIDQNFKLKFL